MVQNMRGWALVGLTAGALALPGCLDARQPASDEERVAAPAEKPAPPVAATMDPGSIAAPEEAKAKRGEAGAMAPSGRAQAADEEEPGAVVPLDPNGRYATTYRPGGGHLAAFEAAVARGIVPEAERELVAEVGARYAPKVAPPKEHALGLSFATERAKLPPSGGPFHLRVGLQGTDQSAKERPNLSVHLVLDTSGSMRGTAIDQARAAAKALVDRLAPTDSFSLVTFSSDAAVRVPAGLVGPRKATIVQAISQIQDGGGTNIGAGLTLGYEQAKRTPDDTVKVVLLLSDGRANSGIVQPAALSKLALDAFHESIQTSSFGLGDSFDGALMSAIADDGAGGYYYLRDPEQIAPALTTELEQRLHPVATAVEVRVRLSRDVDLLHVYGSRRLSDAEAQRVRAIEVAADTQAQRRDGIETDRQEDVEGGMRFFIPAFARGDSHGILLQLRTAAGVGDKRVASIELKYKDRVTKKNVVDEIYVDVPFADSDAKSAATIDASVAKSAQAFAAGETLSRAAILIANGNRSGAETILAEREGLLREAAKTLDEPLFLRDADRLARLRSLAGGPATELGDPLLLSMMMETCGRAHLR